LSKDSQNARAKFVSLANTALRRFVKTDAPQTSTVSPIKNAAVLMLLIALAFVKRNLERLRYQTPKANKGFVFKTKPLL